MDQILESNVSASEINTELTSHLLDQLEGNHVEQELTDHIDLLDCQEKLMNKVVPLGKTARAAIS